MRRILFVNPFGIGDTLFSLVAVEAVRAAAPEAFIGFLCNERTEAIVRLDTSIDRTFVFHRDLLRRLGRKHPLLLWRKLSGLRDALREGRFDTMIDFSLGREYALLAAWSHVRRRVGFDYRGRGTFLTERRAFKSYEGRHVAEFHLDLVETAGFPAARGKGKLPIAIPEETSASVERALRKAGVSPSDSLLAVAPGGGRTWGENARYKQWGPERFAEAAAATGAKAVLLGDRSEGPLVAAVAARLGRRTAVAAVGEPLERVAAYLRRSKALLCNDGGLLHLANALGVRTVSIFGPVDERVYGPYGSDTPHAVLTEPVECRPCYRDFRFPPCPYERRCLELLPAGRAVDALGKM